MRPVQKALHTQCVRTQLRGAHDHVRRRQHACNPIWRQQMRSLIGTAKKLLLPLYLLIPLSTVAVLAGCDSGSDTTVAPGITRIEISSVESPTFEGKTFGSVGAYEKLRGTAFGEVDPNDPRNAVITDLRLAPRNARGNVEYAMDFYILKPIDLA